MSSSSTAASASPVTLSAPVAKREYPSTSSIAQVAPLPASTQQDLPEQSLHVEHNFWHMKTPPVQHSLKHSLRASWRIRRTSYATWQSTAKKLILHFTKK